MSELNQGTPAPAAAPTSILATQSPAQTAPEATAPKFMEEGWLKGVDYELANDPSVKTISDLPNLLKSYVNAQKMIGRDKIVAPNQYTTPEEWKNIYSKLGVPQDPKEYKFDKVKVDEAQAEEFKKFAHENGLLPHQAEAILASKVAEKEAEAKAQSESYAQAKEESFNTLQKEFGAALPQKIQAAKMVVNTLMSEEEQAYLEESGLADDAQFIKFLAKIADKFYKEDNTNPSHSAGAMTPSVAQTEIDAIMSNIKHPYFDAAHPTHERAVQDVHKLYSYLR